MANQQNKAVGSKCVKLTEDNIVTFLDSFETVLTDCDGVLWHGPDCIPGSVDALQKLASLKKRIFYVTNNSTKSRREYVTKCHSMGFPAVEDTIISSAYVAAEYVKHTLDYRGKVFVVGSTGIKNELEELGIPCTGVGPDEVGNMSFADISKLDVDQEINCVIVGLDIYFNYLKLSRAIQYLSKRTCHFIATNDDSVLPTSRGNLPGSGSLLSAVETAAERKPDIICGKPSPLIFEMLAARHNITPTRAVMIGDRLNTDIKLANNCGMISLLVLTGVTSADEIPDETTNVEDNNIGIPDFYIESLEKLLELIGK